MNKIKITVRMPDRLYKGIYSDLDRLHDHATERVGFISSRLRMISENEYVILMTDYHPVKDEHYIKDYTVGAHINAASILEVMQRTITEHCGGFHVHKHWGEGVPYFSRVDMESLPHVIESFRVNSSEAHGLFLLNDNSLNCLVWLPNIESPVYATQITVVGYPLKIIFPETDQIPQIPNWLNRQSFLGEHSYQLLKTLRIGIVGLGGGGSHIMQQLAHLGVENYVLFDPDQVEDTNLNRMVGARKSDIEDKTDKVVTAKRLINGVNDDAIVQDKTNKWEDNSALLNSCDLVFGCIDSISGRRDLEAQCRRYYIPLLDIGMDVHSDDQQGYAIRGQVILSMPGCACMQCYNFINEGNLSNEAARYGNAGGNPQVIWSNGILASSAVGIAVDLITSWSGQEKRRVYLSYDGNTHTVCPHVYEEFPLFNECPHYPTLHAGPPKWKSLGSA